MASNLSRLSPLPFSLCGLLLAFPPFFPAAILHIFLSLQASHRPTNLLTYLHLQLLLPFPLPILEEKWAFLLPEAHSEPHYPLILLLVSLHPSIPPIPVSSTVPLLIFFISIFKCPYLSQLKTKFSVNSTTSFLVSPSSPSKPLPRVIYMHFPCTEASALATPPNLLSNVVNKLFVAKFGVHLFRRWLT